MSTATCVIWNTPAELLESGGDYKVFDSPRAGGKYWISNSAIAEMVPYNERVRLSLTTWLCEQRRAGLETPKLSSHTLSIVASRQPLLIMTRMTATLRYVGLHIAQLGDSIQIGGGNLHTFRLLAETESKNIKELSQLMRMLEETGYIQGTFLMDGGANVQPTAQGWQELEKLQRVRTDSAQVFVAMWFSEAMNDVYVQGIEPALSSMGYKAVRIDKKEHNNKIDDEIIAEIRRSRFLIADFTCEPKSVRGGVYYEAGFAQGLNLPVIWTCKDTSLPDLHFDTRQYSHIVWKAPADLLLQLRNRIGATIGDGPLPRSNA